MRQERQSMSGNTDDSAALSKVVALTYNAGAVAPKVIAKGNGYLAGLILARAQELGIPTKSDPALVEFLMELKLNQLVPPELYGAIAEVLAWAYEQDGSDGVDASSAD
jgi:flagellar biosynthesis protein